jgi:hypothetical protein
MSPTTPTNTPAQSSAFSKEIVKTVVAEGKTMLKDSKTKVQVATAMYAKLKGADRETVVAAFKEGAGLTEKGAVTYWYNCKRKTAKPVVKT